MKLALLSVFLALPLVADEQGSGFGLCESAIVTEHLRPEYVCTRADPACYDPCAAMAAEDWEDALEQAADDLCAAGMAAECAFDDAVALATATFIADWARCAGSEPCERTVAATWQAAVDAATATADAAVDAALEAAVDAILAADAAYLDALEHCCNDC